ncbi:MAG: 3'-5' exonuclease [Pseudomonadota bacterium]
MNTLVFDIETIPDLETGRRIHGLEGLSDDEVAQAMASLRVQAKGHDFQPAHLHRIVAISVVLRTADELKVLSLGEENSSEAELIRKFFDGLDRYKPTLVSWNGGGFDLPVLHYRALRHGVTAKTYWDTSGEAKWNSYIGRYQFRHTDLMDVLALYQARNNAPLDEIAQLLGFPGKLGMDGSKVFEAWRAGKLAEIRAYCETDVLNTWLIYLRFQLMRGQLSAETHQSEVQRVRQFLAGSQVPHWAEFSAAWK